MSAGITNRGIVISCPIEIDGTKLHIRTTEIDRHLLRLSTLYFSKIAWPMNNIIGIGSGPDEQFLEDAGVLTRPMVRVAGDAAQGFALAHVMSFMDLEKETPGLWSLAEGPDSFLVRNGILAPHDKTLSVELIRAIPTPDREVPLNEILEFKSRRASELEAFHSEISAISSALSHGDGGEEELRKAIEGVDKACRDTIKLGKEWRFPVRLSNLKISLDLRPSPFIAGLASDMAFGLPFVCSTLGAVGSVLKLTADLAPQSIKPRLGPFRYVHHVNTELLC